MKKIIGLLSIILLLVLGGLAYLEEDDKNSWNRINLETPYEEDAEVKALLEQVNSININNKEESGSLGSINGEKTGLISRINIYEQEAGYCLKEVEEIESVLGVEGVADYIYSEEQKNYDNAAFEQLELYETMERSRRFGDVIVSVTMYKDEEAVDKTKEPRDKTISIDILRDQLVDDELEALGNKLKGDGYYLTDVMIGGAENMFIFNNDTALKYRFEMNKRMSENGQIMDTMPTRMRYEVLAKEGQVTHVRGVANAKNRIVIDGEDRDMLVRVAGELGLNDGEILHLNQVIDETLAKPMKDRKETIGTWEYVAKYTQKGTGSEQQMTYLDITIQ